MLKVSWFSQNCLNISDRFAANNDLESFTKLHLFQLMASVKCAFRNYFDSKGILIRSKKRLQRHRMTMFHFFWYLHKVPTRPISNLWHEKLLQWNDDHHYYPQSLLISLNVWERTVVINNIYVKSMMCNHRPIHIYISLSTILLWFVPQSVFSRLHLPVIPPSNLIIFHLLHTHTHYILDPITWIQTRPIQQLHPQQPSCKN